MEDTKKIVVETLELEKNAVFFVFFVKGFACGCFWKCCKGHFNLCCLYVPGSELPISGMVIPPLLRNPFNGYTNPYYWVEDNPIQSTMNIIYFVEIMAVSTPSPMYPSEKDNSHRFEDDVDGPIPAGPGSCLCRDMSHVHDFWGSGNMCGWMVFFKLGSLHLPSITMVSDIFPTQKKHTKHLPSPRLHLPKQQIKRHSSWQWCQTVCIIIHSPTKRKGNWNKSWCFTLLSIY